MLEYDFRSGVGYWLHMTAHRFERAMNAEASAEGMTYRQCQVLAWLSLEGELAQCDLAERMNGEPPTLVRVLDCMERDGLVERVGCPDDRRRKVIRPTAKAVPVWEKIVGCVNRVRARSVRGLSPEEIGTLRGLLERVHDNLGEPASAGPNLGCGGAGDEEAPRRSAAANGHKTSGPRPRREGATRR